VRQTRVALQLAFEAVEQQTLGGEEGAPGALLGAPIGLPLA